MPFTCSICGEESTRICASCTKDACGNHLCEKCLRCSDCCDCEVRISESAHEAARPMTRTLPPAPAADPFRDETPQLRPSLRGAPEIS
jgi:hypothetical protein